MTASFRRVRFLLFLTVFLAAALPRFLRAQAIIGTAGGSNQAIVYPSPESGLPTPVANIVPGLPANALPQGVSYYGSDNALMSDAFHSRVFVIQISTASLLDTIDTSSIGYDGAGTIAVAPGLTAALASGDASSVTVISAPFGAGSTLTSVALPGSIPGYQTQAIVFNAAGRAFVNNSGGISVLDPPYTSVAFTIPVAATGAIAITPDGNTLLTTEVFSSIVHIFTAPFSPSSMPVDLDLSQFGGFELDGIAVTPDGSTALVIDISSGLWAIDAPFTASSKVETINLVNCIPSGDCSFGGFEDVGISADGQFAILAGDGNGIPDTPFVQAPFTAAGATVYDVQIAGGRGNGSVRFLPPGLAPGLTITKSGPASIASGSDMTYTITYGNTGGAAADNVVIQDPVPTGTSFVSASGGGTFANGVVTWNIGTVNAGVTGLTVTFTVHVDATSGTIANVNYTIAGTGIPPIAGPPVFTTITGGCPPITVSPSTLPNGTQGVSYSQTLTASGGTPPYSFAVSAGVLPPGLTLASGGLLSGTPTSSGTFSFTVSATDALQCVGSQAYSVTIVTGVCPPPPAPSLSASPGVVSIGQKITLTWNQTIAAGQGSYTVQVSIDGGVFADIGSVPATGSATVKFTYRPQTPGTLGFRVLAVPSCDPSQTSTSNTAIVTVTGPCANAPVVTGVAVNPTSELVGGSFTLTWNPAGSSSTYGVFQSTDGGQTFQLIGQTIKTSFTGTVAGQPGAVLTFEVEVLGCVYSKKSNFATLTILSATCDPPGAVTNIEVQAFGVAPARPPSPTEYILVSWTAPSTGTTPVRYGVRINGDPEVLVVGNSVVLPPRGTPDPITVFVTAFACAPFVSGELYDPVAGTWSATGNLAVPRQEHTATVLADGRVLVAGGAADLFGTPLGSAELYDPASAGWTATGLLGSPRELHAATLLSTGEVLVEGGFDQQLSSAELYDPVGRTFSSTGALTTARDLHTATLLSDGRVLVAGGLGSVPLDSSELYDPAAKSWTATGALGTARYRHTATLLSNGKVLVVGGFGAAGALASAELYDPATGAWASTGSLATAREAHTATLLSSGKVLVAGGDDGSSPLSSAELYDPAAGTWAATGNLIEPRRSHTATTLAGGRVLIAGGFGASLDKSLTSAELYDPASGTFSATGSLNGSHGFHTASFISSGKVLVVGAAASQGTEKSGTTVSSPTIALFLSPPVASFTISANPVVGSPVSFTDTSSPQATSWLWIFDDGTTSTVQSPTKVFTTAGTHQVSLVASNGAGSSTATQTFVVAAAPSSTRLAVVVPTSSEDFAPTDSGRWRARVEVLGKDSVFLRIAARDPGETIVFLRFLDGTGHLVAERRLSIQAGAEAVYDLGAYGLRGAFSLELVSVQKFEPTLSVVRRPGVREIQR